MTETTQTSNGKRNHLIIQIVAASTLLILSAFKLSEYYRAWVVLTPMTLEPAIVSGLLTFIALVALVIAPIKEQHDIPNKLVYKLLIICLAGWLVMPYAYEGVL